MNTIEKIYELYLKCNQNISTDSRSRNIQNSIFFGINGKNFNGNHFAHDAIKKGASFAIIDEDIDTQLPNIIKVDNSLYALQELAKKHRSYWGTDSNSKIIIGITGTNGKTTTKELLKNIISSEKKVCCTEGNQNNHIGVPLTILKLRKEHDIGIIELGANHIGEIKTLCLIANPTHGIITNIGEAHLEGFKNITNIINTKNELYNHIKQNNGVIFFNTLDSVLLNLIGTYQKVIPYKIIELNNTIKKTETDLYFECALFIKLFWFNNIIKTKIPGNYNAQNIAASIRVAQYFNISIKNITDTLKVVELKNNRSQFIDTGKRN